ATKDFARVVRRVAPVMARIEGLLRPRHSAIVAPAGERLIGVMCALLALLLPVPLPFGNAIVVLPIVILALGLLERDGRVALGGLFAGVACASLFVALTWATLRGSFQLASHYIGHAGLTPPPGWPSPDAGLPGAPRAAPPRTPAKPTPDTRQAAGGVAGRYDGRDARRPGLAGRYDGRDARRPGARRPL
ncbi:MAG TPA: exopolysaccharide biosynthesis protein, partial [Polyangiaceae bacterium]|nr:exopolysaccharide biosynthesis protein [Polyangiaceae bacterium]